MAALISTLPEPKFTLLDRFSPSHLVLVLIFLLSSIYLIKPNQKIAGTIHFFLLCLIILLYPRSELFGRSGTPIIFVGYFFFFVFSTKLFSREYKLLASTLLICLVIVEAIVPKINTFVREPKMSEWADFVDGFNLHEGGYLLPNIHANIVSEFPESKFITNEFGFRNEKNINHKKPVDTFRIIFLGDSFVVGYRSDQKDMIGSVLEFSLKDDITQDVEVLNTGIHDTAWALRYIDQHAHKFDPDLIVVGITLGNDITGSHATTHGLRPSHGEMGKTLLPESAFTSSVIKELAIRFDRNLTPVEYL